MNDENKGQLKERRNNVEKEEIEYTRQLIIKSQSKGTENVQGFIVNIRRRRRNEEEEEKEKKKRRRKRRYTKVDTAHKYIEETNESQE